MGGSSAAQVVAGRKRRPVSVVLVSATFGPFQVEQTSLQGFIGFACHSKGPSFGCLDMLKGFLVQAGAAQQREQSKCVAWHQWITGKATVLCRCREQSASPTSKALFAETRAGLQILLTTSSAAWTELSPFSLRSLMQVLFGKVLPAWASRRCYLTLGATSRMRRVERAQSYKAAPPLRAVLEAPQLRLQLYVRCPT